MIALDTTNTNRLYYAYIVDKDGFVVTAKVFDVDDEVDETVVKTFIPQGLFKAKWNGDSWIEGETAEEKADREAQQALDSLTPTPEEISDAELEIKVITLLMEMGAI